MPFPFFGQVNAALPFKTYLSLEKEGIHFSLGNLRHCLKFLLRGPTFFNWDILLNVFIHLTDTYWALTVHHMLLNKPEEILVPGGWHSSSRALTWKALAAHGKHLGSFKNPDSWTPPQWSWVNWSAVEDGDFKQLKCDSRVQGGWRNTGLGEETNAQNTCQAVVCTMKESLAGKRDNWDVAAV